MSSTTTRPTHTMAFQPKEEACHGKSRSCVAENLATDLSPDFPRKLKPFPLPAHPQGQLSGAVPGMSQTSPEPDLVTEDLSRQILCRLSKHDNFYVGMAVISRLQDLVGDLPASANHHHSEP